MIGQVLVQEFVVRNHSNNWRYSLGLHLYGEAPNQRYECHLGIPRIPRTTNGVNLV